MGDIKAIFIEGEDLNLVSSLVGELHNNGYVYTTVNLLKGKSKENLEDILSIIKTNEHLIIDLNNSIKVPKDINILNTNEKNIDKLMDLILEYV